MRFPRKRVLLPVAAALLCLDLTVTAGTLSNSEAMDIMYGKGNQTIVENSGTDTENTLYYRQLYTGRMETEQHAQSISGQISDEGIVLLKNDGLLPLDRERPVSPFGYGYFKPLYCGTGSSAISTASGDVLTPSEAIHAVFNHVNDALENIQTAAFQSTGSDSRHLIWTEPVGSEESAYRLCEFSPAVWASVPVQGSVGLVFITRQAGEFTDYWTGRYRDGTPHMLALTDAEHTLIDNVKDTCNGVVVILSCSSPMQIPELVDDEDISAILWLGGAGSRGYYSLAKILAGEVVPSGRTPCLFAANFQSDPTFANQDDGSDAFLYSNYSGTILTGSRINANSAVAFHEYEEGVYYGYRYYETADQLDVQDYYNRADGVVFPFGYGLSYTDFSQKILGFTQTNGEISVQVQVANTGSCSGKEVVQLYFTPPWTDLDVLYQIEKPAVNLIQFAKTSQLSPGESEILTLRFSLEDLASYAASHPNDSGSTGCYVLEGGSYTFSIRKNSHEILDSFELLVPDTLWYDEQRPRSSEQANWTAVNRFPQLNAYTFQKNVSHMVLLSRSDWLNTQPTAPSALDRTASETVLAWLRESDPLTPVTQSSSPETVLPGEDRGIRMIDLRGLDYGHPLWEDLLDQLSFNEPEVYQHLLFEAQNETGALLSIAKPSSTEHDGPQGFTVPDIYGKNWLSDVTAYPSAPVQAATWNKDLMYEYGVAIAQEALIHKYDGWYAPGLNLQRSPFGGRSSEYFGEDPLLAGLLAAQIVSGAGDNGLVCAIKHFVLIDTEAHRSPQTCVWLSEQALREVYLRPFEIVIKNASMNIRYNASGTVHSRTIRAGTMIMVSDCAVGTEWTAFSDSLLTNLLRGEWGFEGTVISDMHSTVDSVTLLRMLNAGCDLLMSNTADNNLKKEDYDNPGVQLLLRRAVKNLCYTLVHTNLMQGIGSTSTFTTAMSPWKHWLIVANILVGVFLVFCFTLCSIEWISEHREK